MTAPRVLGVDLSLTATGIAPAMAPALTIKPGDRTSTARIRFIRDKVLDAVTFGRVDLVVVEGPSYGSIGGKQHERGGLWWVIAVMLEEIGKPYAVVPPTSLKLYAAGKGGASKGDMRMSLYKRMGIDDADDNRVDARWLAAMGMDHLGYPLVEQLPARQRAAIDKITWPEVGR